MARPKGSTSNAPERLRLAAGRGFRVGGFGGIGVDGLAKEAGLTSGAFYTHFGSKAEAFRIALHDGFEFFQSGIAALKEKHGESWVPALIDFYFRERMEVELCDACDLPSLTADAMRSEDSTRHLFEQDLEKLARTIAGGLTGESTLSRAWVLLSLFAGGSSLARTVTDPIIRQQLLDSVRTVAHQVCQNATWQSPGCIQSSQKTDVLAVR